ncbi:MAG: imidazolonepropionase [Lutibacter sp.]
MTTLFTNIKELIQVEDKPKKRVKGSDMNQLKTIKNAFLLVEDNLIKNFGSMEEYVPLEVDNTIDLTGKLVLPTWVDSHTHIVYAGNRVQEFVDRINGLTYEQIANNGGGILNSAIKLGESTEEELYNQAAKRLHKLIKLGTGAIEIKTGYGLLPQAELKMLKVIKRLQENFPIPIKATFLAAHAIPSKYKLNKTDYINLIINQTLPLIAKENIAEFIDIFIETGYFDANDAEKILNAAKSFGLIPKLHINQFSSIGGIEIAKKWNALSIDHLEVLSANEINLLKNSNIMPVALPSCSYFLSIPYTPGRQIIDNGLPLALASDYNPGSTPSGNMNFVVSTACIKMKLTPEEAINAATINGAYSINLSDKIGSICKGKLANFIVTKNIPSYAYLPYSFGENLISQVYINGKLY